MLQLPAPFINQLKQLIPNGYEQLVASMEKDATTSVRLNPDKHAETGFPAASAIPWSRHGFFLQARPSFIFDPLFHAGAYYVQEASSMFIEHIFRQMESQLPVTKKVLDLCAAPGGKSTLLNSCLGENDLLVSNEIIKTRINALAENMMKWGHANNVITNNDPRQFQNLPSFFDLILIDAPCSGEGMFRKDKKAIQEWSQHHVQLCQLRQQRIMDDVIHALKPGGFLIYSTCTFNTLENESNVLNMMKKYGLTSRQIGIEHAWGIEEVSSFNNQHLFAYRFYPHQTQGEGFFVSCLQKPSEDEKKQKVKPLAKLNFLAKKEIGLAASYLKQPEKFSFFHENNCIKAFPATQEANLALLKSVLRVVSNGVNIGTAIKNQLVPDHALALSNELAGNVAGVELDKDNSLLFLKKGSLPASLFPGTGWFLATYKGLGLGWIKAIQGRTNNYLPTNLRILKDLEP